MPMQDESSPDTGLTLPGFQMYERVEGTTSDQSMCWPEAFPVSRTASPENARHQPMRASCGVSSRDLFASLDRAMCWLKMYQGYTQASMDGSLEPFSGTWPRAGMMRNGNAYRRRPLVPPTRENGCSLWPTPRARDWRSGKSSARTRARNSRPLNEIAAPGGPLNPLWVEWLMGFPPGWTDCEG